MRQLWQDLRYGARMLIRQPGFTLIAVLTLALGIGASTAIFSVINAYLFKPLPVREAGRLVVLGVLDQHFDLPHYTSWRNYEELRQMTDVFADVIAGQLGVVNFDVNGEGERSFVELVSGNYFSALGVDAIHGRTFAPNEGFISGSAPVVVLSHGYWQRRFGGDAAVIGQTVKLNGTPFTIIGVLPESFPGTQSLISVEAWAPQMMSPQLFANGTAMITERSYEGLRVMARLKAGVTLEQARAALHGFAEGLRQRHPELYRQLSFLVVPETSARPELSVASAMPVIATSFFALVALVLLIACANVANLILSRAMTRERELAIRSALGAGRLQLLRLLLIESLLLGLVSGVAGALLAVWTTDLLSAIRFALDTPIRFNVQPDWRVFVFALGIALTTGFVAGLFPAWQASRLNLNQALKAGGHSLAPRRHRVRNLLVVAQVAASLLLLVCAGLFVRSLQQAQKIDLGLRRDNVLLASVDVELQRYDEARGRQFYRRLMERLSQLPQAHSAGLSTLIPLSGNSESADVYVAERSSTTQQDPTTVIYSRIDPGWLRTLDVPLLAGREFTTRDDESAPRVAIINEALAQQLWPGQSAIGRQFRLERNGPSLEVVGVAKNGKYIFIGEAPRALVYVPFAQNYRSEATVYLHTAGDPASVTSAVRQAVRELDQDMLVYDVKTMETHLNSGLAFLFVRVAALLAAVFGAIGLLLALVGLYGVIAQSVTQRTHEIGIRMALGANTGAVLRLVLRQGLFLIVSGAVTGLGIALGVTRLLTNLLYGVSATDPLIFGGVTLLLLLVALLACYLPARRATKVDPMIALRSE
jgi:predicted permease